MEKRVFVSYSRKDSALVDAFANVIRALAESTFIDRKICGGERWEVVLDTELSRANLIVVFWCCHAAKSNWVHKECDRAISDGKAIFPIRLDKTPVPDFLQPFQYQDFSQNVLHWKYPRWIRATGIGLAVLAIAASLIAWLVLQPSTNTLGPNPSALSPGLVAAGIALLGLLPLLIAFARVRARRQRAARLLAESVLSSWRDDARS